MALRYRQLFFDLDHTLWDFDANAELTLRQLYEDLQLATHGIAPFEAFYERYLHHNARLWERYRKGFIRREDLRLKRMWLTLLDFKVADEALARRLDHDYLEGLPRRTLLFPGTHEVLGYLKDRGYHLHIITNGFETTQLGKLHNSHLRGFFGEIITSEGSQSMKPRREIFEYALNKTGAMAKDSIMLGDDPDVDILGARNAGLDQVLVNHKGLPVKGGTATYVVGSLSELRNIF